MNITLHFPPPGYIEHPYWPEMYQRIEIDKKSGVNRARTDANRRRALESYLSEIGMTLKQYEQLIELSERPFHTDAQGRIIILADKMLSALTNASLVAPSKLRIANLRIALHASDFVTEKTEPDGIWERFAVVNMGSGAKASNQRGLRRNAYIENFTATGTIDVADGMVEPKAVVALLHFCGRVVGIGASRKMGRGRFLVECL